MVTPNILDSDVLYVKEDFRVEEYSRDFMGIARLVTKEIIYEDTDYSELGLKSGAIMKPEESRFFLKITSPPIFVKIPDTEEFKNNWILDRSVWFARFASKSRYFAYSFEMIERNYALPIINKP
jgi:hypothetical protein